MRLTILGVVSTLFVTTLATLSATLSSGVLATPAPDRGHPSVHVVSRAVVFSVENTNETSVLCTSDDQSYALRGTMVGPRRDLRGLGGALRVNVLVHDLGTGSWFWHLHGHPAYDYATKLAKHGETSLVLDRLGYGGSKLANGDATCLGAQADMLHQVVQHLRSGRYDFADHRLGSTPAASHVVTQGHSVGAAIAQVEAAAFDDVDGLLLMSWTDRGATSLATRTAAAQSTACGGSTDYAPLAATAKAYRSLLFASAPKAVQKAAAGLRAPDPCGDVTSLAPMLVASNLAAAHVDVPVLLLYGGKDALNRSDARAGQAAAYPTKVTTRTFKGAGSALPLERSAAQVRATVLRWLQK